MSTAEIALSNIKDIVGLVGTVLIAVPFFRLEMAKRTAARLGRAPTRNPRLLGHFQTAERNTRTQMEQPSAPDFQATLWGLLLVGLSFAISLVLPYLGS